MHTLMIPIRSIPPCIPAMNKAVQLLRLSLQLQGRTFGAPGLTAPAMSSEEGREQPRG